MKVRLEIAKKHKPRGQIEEAMPEPTLSDVMAKLESIERRVGELEKLSHPQHVMADPELTEAIRELRQSLKPPKPVNEFEIDYTPHLNTWTRPITLC